MEPFERLQALEIKLSFPFQPARRLHCEARVFKTGERHAQGRSVDGPGFPISGELRDSASFTEKIAEPKPGQGVVFGQRAQHDQIGILPNERLNGFLLDKINESFVDDDKTFTLQSSVSDLFYLNPRDQLARHTVRRREKDNVAIFVPGGHKPLGRELKAVIGAKSKLADIRSR